MALYELLIRGKSDGTISGSHVIEFDGDRPGLARPVTDADWPAIAVDINALLSAQIAALETENDALRAEIEAQRATPEEIAAGKPESRGVDQLTIMERLGDEKAEILEGLISQLPIQARMSWQFSPQIRVTHPLIAETKPILLQALSLTEDELIDILTP